MSFSYDNIIERSNNKDRETNKEFNNKILSDSSTKKKSTQEDIDNMVNKTYEKIFDVIKYNEKNYYLDKNLGTIWDENTEIVGLINKNQYIWFEEQELLYNKDKNMLDELDYYNKTLC